MKVKNIDFKSIPQVPNIDGGILMKSLIKAESKLARVTGYNVKIVKQSGVQLCRLFESVFPNQKCHGSQCPACANNSKESGSGCRRSNIVSCTRLCALNVRLWWIPQQQLVLR